MRILVSALFVASSIAGVAAQGGVPAPQGQRPIAGEQQQPAERAPAAAAKMVISGCIQNAPAPAAGAPAGTAGAASATAAKFVLANAKVAPAAASGTAPIAARYQLEGQDKTVATHLNHQVEITGTVQSVSLTTPGAGSGGPTLRVESVKMVAEKCS